MVILKKPSRPAGFYHFGFHITNLQETMPRFPLKGDFNYQKMCFLTFSWIHLRLCFTFTLLSSLSLSYYQSNVSLMWWLWLSSRWKCLRKRGDVRDDEVLHSSLPRQPLTITYDGCRVIQLLNYGSWPCNNLQLIKTIVTTSESVSDKNKVGVSWAETATGKKKERMA